MGYRKKHTQLMETYNTYKDSGIEWIGEIPEHWEIISFNRAIFLRHGYQFRDHDFTLNGIRIIKISQLLQNGKLDTENTSFVHESRLNNFKDILINEGDILMALTGGTIGKIIKTPKIKETLLQNYRVGNFFPLKDSLIKNFLFWVLSSRLILEQIFYDQRETGQPNIGKESFGRMKILIPPIKEQTNIANYLDQKTAELDALIADKQQLLKLYEEEKTAIINQAVTKGINPKVTLKDSGIEWLGEIPEHWELKKFKYFFKLITDRRNNNLIKIGLENIEGKSGNFIQTESDFSGEGIHFIPDDILFGKLRPYLAKVWKADFEGEAVGDFYIFRSNQILADFAKYRLLDFSFIDLCNSSTYGAKMPRVSWEFIANSFIGFPKKDEQQQIVIYIETELEKINAKQKKTERLINLLTEYREALISEVVTGKVKVPN